MEKLKFNKHYIRKCYINFYNLEPGFLEDLIYDLKRWLNYKDGRVGIETSEVKMYLICNGGYFFWSGFEPNPNEGYINCGDNINYFLAVAALRDDTDDFQWFIYNSMDCTVEKLRNFYWFKCEEDKIEDMMYWDCAYLNCTKATVEEIIEHFNGKN